MMGGYSPHFQDAQRVVDPIAALAASRKCVCSECGEGYNDLFLIDICTPSGNGEYRTQYQILGCEQKIRREVEALIDKGRQYVRIGRDVRETGGSA